MSEKNGTRSSTNQRKSRKLNTANQENGTQVSSSKRPTKDDREEWKAYWKAQGQPWRTEPEIDLERQKYLTDRRSILPDIEQGIYPFKGVKLSRADVEWLLITHENGRGPVNWSDESQRGRMGLDLRGTNLRQVDLSDLPLTRLQAGLAPIKIEWNGLTEGQRVKAVMLLAGADFIGAHLEEVNLTGAHLEGAYLSDAHLEGAYLCIAHLEEAHLAWAHLKLADFAGAHLERTNMTGAHLEEASLDNAILGDKQGIGPRLVDIHWDNTHLAVVDWSPVKKLGEEHEAQQKKTPHGTMKDKTTSLDEYRIAVRANRQLAVVLRYQGLNEEADYFAYRAQVLHRCILWLQIGQRQWIERLKGWVQQSSLWKLFVERWLKIQQSVAWKQLEKLGQLVNRVGTFAFSKFLDLLTGYGYKPGRTIFWYLVVILGFATTYYVQAPLVKVGGKDVHLSFIGALIFSITAFHGRGFFLGGDFGYANLVTILAALEAVIGLLIELSFIATFTGRFLRR